MSAKDYSVTRVSLNDIKYVKFLHNELARSLKRGDVKRIIDFYKSKWGKVAEESATKYPVVNLTDVIDKPTFLAYLIYERMLLKESGLLKNLAVALFGTGGTGKTSYSVASCIQALVMSGMPLNEAIKLTSSLVLFDPDTTVSFFKEVIRNRQWVPFIIVDDVGAQISKYWMFLKKTYWAHFFSILDHIKDWTGVLILTAKHEKRAPAGMRDLIDFSTLVFETDIPSMSNQGVYVGTSNTSASPSRLFERESADMFSMVMYEFYLTEPRKLEFVDVTPLIRIPNEIWRKMLDARTVIGLERVKIVEKALESERRKRESMPEPEETESGELGESNEEEGGEEE